jgi:hypothetical protein
MDVICNYIDVHPKWHPRGRWLNFEGAAAGGGGGGVGVGVGSGSGKPGRGPRSQRQRLHQCAIGDDRRAKGLLSRRSRPARVCLCLCMPLRPRLPAPVVHCGAGASALPCVCVLRAAHEAASGGLAVLQAQVHAISGL